LGLGLATGAIIGAALATPYPYYDYAYNGYPYDYGGYGYAPVYSYGYAPAYYGGYAAATPYWGGYRGYGSRYGGYRYAHVGYRTGYRGGMATAAYARPAVHARAVRR
jgi:hypothetical protein